MKKSILFAMFLGGVFAANAQITTPGAPQTADATINVKLYPIQTIIVNPLQKAVDLEYKTVADYDGEVSSEQENHLNIYSTGAFEVSVKSTAADLTTTSTNPDNKKIAASDIKITATDGTLNELTGATMPEVTLAMTPAALITSGTGGFNKNFNVTYAATGEYLNHYLDGTTGTNSASAVTTYTVGVQYTIAPK